MYDLLWETGAFKEPTKNISYLHKHGQLDLKQAAAEAMNLVALTETGDDVVLLSEPNVPTADSQEKIQNRIQQLTPALDSLSREDQNGILRRVGELWSIDIEPLLRVNSPRLTPRDVEDIMYELFQA